MPTSPGADLQSPAAQSALFSSPPQMHSSGGCLQMWGMPWLIRVISLRDGWFSSCCDAQAFLGMSWCRFSLKQLGREAELVQASAPRKIL